MIKVSFAKWIKFDSCIFAIIVTRMIQIKSQLQLSPFSKDLSFFINYNNINIMY